MPLEDPRPLLDECKRELPVANHVQGRIVNQVISEEFPQVKHGDDKPNNQRRN